MYASSSVILAQSVFESNESELSASFISKSRRRMKEEGGGGVES
jgi:hypothetical protein